MYKNEEFSILFKIKNIYNSKWGAPIYFKMRSSLDVFELVGISTIDIE